MSDEGWRDWIEGLPDASMTISGFYEPYTYEIPPSTPWRLLIPRRRWLRWEIVEYRRSGGPVTRTLHDRRFWLARSARRYAERLGGFTT